MGINRKTAGQLHSYAAVFLEHANLVNNMAPVQEISRELVREMRQQASAGNVSDSMAVPRMPAPNPSSRISFGSSVVAAGAAGVEAGAGADMNEPIEDGCRHESMGGEGGSRLPANKFRSCRECGHHKAAWPQHQHNPGPRSGQYHVTMPADQWCTETENVFVKAQWKRSFPPCKCVVCRDSYEES